MRLALALVTVICAINVGCSAPRPKRAPTNIPKTLSFELFDVGGNTVATEDFKGRVLLVDFWATWCKPCEKSFPFYTKLHERLGNKGLTILAVSVDAEDDDVFAFLKRSPVPFTVVRDPDGKIPERLDIKTMPTAFIIGRDGRVRHVHAGFVPGDEKGIEREVRLALTSTVGAPKL